MFIQFVPNLAAGDAIGNDVLAIDQAVRSRGLESRIYAAHFDSELSSHCHPLSELNTDGFDSCIAVYHYSTASPLTDLFCNLRTTKVLIYHNITPAEYFEEFDPNLAEVCRQARNDLPKLRDDLELALADSSFNMKELVALGFENTHVLPIFFDTSLFVDAEPDAEVINHFTDEPGTNILFVSRIAPHKKQHELLLLFYYYKTLVDPHARLFIVGTPRGAERYMDILQDLVCDLALDDVYITGQIGQEQLAAYYRLADIYVSLSEHEGFSVALLEAMHFGLPIVAYATGAIPETLGGTGVLVHKKNFDEMAELIGLIMEDGNWRSRIIEKQRNRLHDFSLERVNRTFFDLFDPLFRSLNAKNLAKLKSR